ncbi:MAG: hypothetical protein H0T97_00390 [Actinobacteria bacterium]|nr:hypothetical protein [Actinomycetota bacterium]
MATRRLRRGEETPASDEIAASVVARADGKLRRRPTVRLVRRCLERRIADTASAN